jgi:homoserine kinase
VSFVVFLSSHHDGHEGKQDRREFNISLPATSANGPAFDAAAMALDLALPVKAKKLSIVAIGRDSDICSRRWPSTVDLQRCAGGGRESHAAAHVRNDFRKGFGSRGGQGIIAMVPWTFMMEQPHRQCREQHPAAACWMGGVTVARVCGNADALVARFVPKGKWPLLLAIPDEDLSTEKARAVLPQEYSRADAVANIQNSMLLLAALFQGDRKLLGSSLEDRIHQPYRAELCPLLPALQDFSESDGVLGVALSGAGPSVLIFLDPKLPVEKSRLRVANRLRASGFSAELLLTSIAKRGGEASFLRRSH